MDYVSGEILTTDGFQKGFLGFEKDIVVEKGKGKCPKKPVSTGLIVPTFINFHTHIGDSFIRKKNIPLSKNINDLVGPPNGAKHKLLKEASSEEIIRGMKVSISTMAKHGTSLFCDFRENGFVGISLLKSALKYCKLNSIILSRPNNLEYNKEEVNNLLDNSDGIGISSISDWDYSEVEKIAKKTKSKQKIFALHASERIREDIDLILNLKPDFLVHMVKASASDLLHVKENNIPIVLCPRSNIYFGLKPDIKLMKNTRVNILLGTDNAMLNEPNILNEIRFIKKQWSLFSDSELLNMVTYNARKVLNLDCNIHGPNSKAEFVVLDKKSLQPLYIKL